MLYRSHRGGVYYTPENTMPAFSYALESGYDYIETDPQLTLDGVVVLMHDGTINRTCRNSDGSRIENPVEVMKLIFCSTSVPTHLKTTAGWSSIMPLSKIF